MSKEKIYIFDTTLRDGAQTEGVDFFERIRKTYLALAQKNPKRFFIINSDQELPMVKKDIFQYSTI